MKTIVYKATNKLNGKWYVGSTLQDLESRILQHKNKVGNYPFQNALRKNPKSFTWEVLSEVDGDDRSHEQEILDCFFGSEYCYNLSPYANGGRGWSDISPETQQKNGKNVACFYHSLSENDPELYHSHQSEKGKKGAKVVHLSKGEDGKGNHAKRMGERSVEVRRKDPEKMGREMKRASHRVRRNGKSRRIKATYTKTGDEIVFDSYSHAHFLIGGRMSYNGLRKKVKNKKEVNGYLLEVL